MAAKKRTSLPGVSISPSGLPAEHGATVYEATTKTSPLNQPAAARSWLASSNKSSLEEEIGRTSPPTRSALDLDDPSSFTSITGSPVQIYLKKSTIVELAGVCSGTSATSLAMLGIQDRPVGEADGHDAT